MENITCKEDYEAYKKAENEAAAERHDKRMEAEADALPHRKECTMCEGTGLMYISCCGDDIRGNDIDLCPTCGEHQGDEGEPCEECNGTGFIED